MHRAALTRSAAFSIPLARSAHAGKLYRTRNNRFLRVNDAQALNDPEMAVVGLGDVRVHANVMLTGHHFSRTARPSAILAWSSALITSSCLREPASFTAASQSFM